MMAGQASSRPARDEPGMTAARLKALFETLKAGLLPLLRQIGDRSEQVRADFLDRDYPEEAQCALRPGTRSTSRVSIPR